MLLKFTLCALLLAVGCIAEERPRLMILTDIGGDPDDQQSLIRLMVYANEFEIEGLIASSAGIPRQVDPPVTRPDLIREIIAAYGKVRPNLMRHAPGWPATADLLRVVKAGNPQRGREHIGENYDTEASRWLVERIDAGTPERPLNIAIWGGQTDFAQALWRVQQDRGTDRFARFVRLFRVYDIADQDVLADWMRTKFPGMYYVLSKARDGHDRLDAAFRGMYLGGDESLTSREWIDAHVRNRGPLGNLYLIHTSTAPNPHGCLKEGDTPSWFFFLPAGGNDPTDPTKPGWGGQFQRSSDGWFRDLTSGEANGAQQSVSRWRPQFQADFARRMAWCTGD